MRDLRPLPNAWTVAGAIALAASLLAPAAGAAADAPSSEAFTAGQAAAQDAAASAPAAREFTAGQAAADSLAAALAELGFENVRVLATPARVLVAYENRMYRYELRAIGAVAAISAAAIDSARVLEIVPESRGIPIVSLAALAGEWRRFLEVRADAAWFRARLKIRSDPASPELRRLRSERERRSSRWMTDVALRPLLDLEFGMAEDPVRLSAALAPEATMSPARGTLLTVQGIIRVKEEIDTFRRDVAPGRTTLSVGGWLPWSWLGTISGGYFPGERYGLSGEAAHLFWNGAFELRAGADLSGALVFEKGATLYSTMEAWSAAASLTHRTPKIDLETTISAGRFLHGDVGVRVDAARRFGETEIGFFAIDTDKDRLGGFRMSIPLPVERLGTPRRVRPVTVPAFPWEYRETSSTAGRRVRLFDTVARFRKGLHPTFVRNNLDDMRAAPERARAGAP